MDAVAYDPLLNAFWLPEKQEFVSVKELLDSGNLKVVRQRWLDNERFTAAATYGDSGYAA